MKDIFYIIGRLTYEKLGLKVAENNGILGSICSVSHTGKKINKLGLFKRLKQTQNTNNIGKKKPLANNLINMET